MKKFDLDTAAPEARSEVLRLQEQNERLLEVVRELAETPWEKIHLRKLQDKARLALEGQ